MTKKLVLLHGLFGTSSDWNSVKALFEDYEVVTLTLPGHGTTPKTLDTYSIANLSEWIYQKVKDWGPCHYLGYSLGGRVLLDIYSKHPEIFQSLILESSSPGLVAESEKKLRVKIDRDNREQLLQNPAAFFMEWYQQPIFFSLQLQSEIYKSIISERMSNFNSELQKLLLETSPGANQSLWETIKSVKNGLYIAGRLDTKYSNLSQSLVAQNPNFGVEIIEHVGHCAHRESPHEFARVVLNFLSGVKNEI